MSCLIEKSPLQDSTGTISAIEGRDKDVHAFLNSISLE